MTRSTASDARRGTPLWRAATVLYTVGLVVFLGAFALLFPAYFLDEGLLDVIAAYLFLGVWPVLFVAAVLDVLRRR
jgi:hypothetical protein